VHIITAGSRGEQFAIVGQFVAICIAPPFLGLHLSIKVRKTEFYSSSINARVSALRFGAQTCHSWLKHPQVAVVLDRNHSFLLKNMETPASFEVAAAWFGEVPQVEVHTPAASSHCKPRIRAHLMTCLPHTLDQGTGERHNTLWRCRGKRLHSTCHSSRQR
jgi:hypothetical protein